MSWKLVGHGAEGQPLNIEGLNVWDHRWHNTGRNVTIADPAYGEPRELVVWEIADRGRVFSFAAGELSSNYWIFYEENASE